MIEEVSLSCKPTTIILEVSLLNHSHNTELHHRQEWEMRHCTHYSLHMHAYRI